MKRILSSETLKHIGKKIKLEGWVNVRRDHGKIIFIDLRDKDGLIQVVFIPNNREVYKIGNNLKPEYVVSIEGIVNKRPKGMENPKLASGTVEVLAKKADILNKSKTPPFEIKSKSQKQKQRQSLIRYKCLQMRKKKQKWILS